MFTKMTAVALVTMTTTAATGAFAAGHGSLTAIALSDDATLHHVDAGTATVTRSVQVSGVTRLLGIDLRPATGQLIGVTDAFEIVEIDAATGKTKVISTMDIKMDLAADAAVIVDFNPMANKLRFMSGTTNHRVDIETGTVTVDGALAYEKTDMHAGETPAIVAAAYTNAYGKPEATAMFDIDSTIMALIRQTAPNDGTLAAVGKLGIEGSDAYAFDIATDKDGTNTAWLVAAGQLHNVSLEDGSVEKSWDIKDAGDTVLRDITFMTAGM